MEEKNQIIIELIDNIRKQFENNGYKISEETYQNILNKYLNSKKTLEEIKVEIYQLVKDKIAIIKNIKEKERLKKVNIEEYKDKILTIESLDKYGYPNIISSCGLEILSKVDIGLNAPINVKFGSKNGFYKNSANTSSSSLDKFEFVICQIGKMLNVKMAETYKVYSDNSYLGIISENVCDEHETLYMYSQVKKIINKDNEEIKALAKSLEKIGKNKIKIESEEKEYKIPVAETDEEINTVISSFLQVVKALNIREEDKRSIRQDYFNMIILDFIVNNVDRNHNNYGLIINEYGEVSFSKLFDNSTIDIPGFPKGYQQINGFLIEKKKLLNSLYQNYYGDIKHITDTCVYNREAFTNKVYDLCSRELAINEQNWFLSTINENLDMVADKELGKEEVEKPKILEDKTISDNASLHKEERDIMPLQSKEEGPKLVRKMPEPKKDTKKDSNNDGKINLVMILLSVSLVLITTTLIILFKL